MFGTTGESDPFTCSALYTERKNISAQGSSGEREWHVAYYVIYDIVLSMVISLLIYHLTCIFQELFN